MAGAKQRGADASDRSDHVDVPRGKVLPDARATQAAPDQISLPPIPDHGPALALSGGEAGQPDRPLTTDFGAAERVHIHTETTSPPMRSDPVQRPTIPQAVLQQLANASNMHAGQPVELTLSPEELGRVRLSLHTSDGGITVSILTERPETGDLLRRNIDLLAQEFGEIGYSEVTFQFGQRDQSPDQSEMPSEEGDIPLEPLQTDAVVTLTIDQPDRLDLRL
ncbi:flagellar hook-length control protein FliK [Aliiroseovarius sp. YM-037]|uniref:flagellar hook-length control protein FliK n=1 Tax=Aliiroseovarius sp. YM-037 TaxID=3341728 RepID=UPI003A81084D